MSKIYDKYFSTGDLYDGLSKVMYDIRASRISEQSLVELADELVKKDQISLKSSFEKKRWWGWSKGYVNYLMNGMSTGSVSKEYLLFYAKVSKVVKIRDNVLKVVGVCICLIIIRIIVTLIKSLING